MFLSVKETEQLLLQVDAIGVKLNKWFVGDKERVENVMVSVFNFVLYVSVKPDFSLGCCKCCKCCCDQTASATIMIPKCYYGKFNHPTAYLYH